MSRSAGSVVGRLLADEPVELGRKPLDPSGVLLLGGEHGFRGGQVVEADAGQLLVGVGLALLELLLHVGAAAEAAVDLDVAELGLHPIAPAQPPRDEREDEPDPDDCAAEQQRPGAQVEDSEEVQRERRRPRG